MSRLLSAEHLVGTLAAILISEAQAVTRTILQGVLDLVRSYLFLFRIAKDLRSHICCRIQQTIATGISRIARALIVVISSLQSTIIVTSRTRECSLAFTSI